MERVQQSVSSYYEITEITEMGAMAAVFFSRGGRNLFYLVLAIYLYGDLAIYAAAVAKSIRDVACSYKPPNMTQSSQNISDSEVNCELDKDVGKLLKSSFVAAVLGREQSEQTGRLQNLPGGVCVHHRPVRLLQCDQNQISANSHDPDAVAGLLHHGGAGNSQVVQRAPGAGNNYLTSLNCN